MSDETTEPRFIAVESHELRLRVELPESATFEHLRAFTSKSRILVEAVAVRAVVHDGKFELGLGDKLPYRVTYSGHRITKDGAVGRVESCDYWNNDLSPLPADLRRDIEARIAAFVAPFVAPSGALAMVTP